LDLYTIASTLASIVPVYHLEEGYTAIKMLKGEDIEENTIFGSYSGIQCLES